MFVSHLRDVRESLERCSRVTREIFLSFWDFFSSYLRDVLESLEISFWASWSSHSLDQKLFSSHSRYTYTHVYGCLMSLQIQIYLCIWISRVTREQLLIELIFSSHSLDQKLFSSDSRYIYTYVYEYLKWLQISFWSSWFLTIESRILRISRISRISANGNQN